MPLDLITPADCLEAWTAVVAAGGCVAAACWLFIVSPLGKTLEGRGESASPYDSGGVGINSEQERT